MKCRSPFLTALLAAVVVTLGCAVPSSPSALTDREMISSNPIVVWSDDLADGKDPWHREISTKYGTFVAVMVHGVELGDSWYVWPTDNNVRPMQAVVDELREQYPDTRIVLLACNPGGHSIDTPGVTYATRSVWVLPDRSVSHVLNLSRDRAEDLIGKIDEFTANPWK